MYFRRDDLFEIYFNISLSPFDTLITNYYFQDASKTVLYWMLEEEDLMNFFINANDEEFQTLSKLFKKAIGDFDISTETHRPFIEIKNDQNEGLMETLILSGIIYDIEHSWVYDYIFKTSKACSENEASLACFTVFCKIGKSLKKEKQQDWLDSSSPSFKNYIDTLIKAQINRPQWKRKDIKSANSVYNFYEDLCGDLAE